MNETGNRQQALSNLMVLDLSRDLAGPLVGQMLGDMGALVIKVEQPTAGDETRGWGPPFIAEQSAYFLAFNRNKHALTLELKRPEGKEIALDLVRRADVVIENFRSETAERLGLSAAAIQELNPSVIHLSVSGFGRNSSASGLPGYDLMMQAMSGLMSITGEAEGLPTRFGVAIVDILTGLHGTIAVLAALHDRSQTGKGQWIDLALYDVALSALANVGSSYLNTGREPKRYGNAHPNLVPYQPFHTADGLLIVAVGNDEQWRRFCNVVGLNDLAEDARFRTNADRVQHRDELLPSVEAALQTQTTAHWVNELTKANVPVGPIRTVSEALADPLVTERHLIWEQENVMQGRALRLLASPLAHLSRTPTQLYKTPPALGEDTEWILSQLLGYSAEKIRALKEAGVL